MDGSRGMWDMLDMLDMRDMRECVCVVGGQISSSTSKRFSN